MRSFIFVAASAAFLLVGCPKVDEPTAEPATPAATEKAPATPEAPDLTEKAPDATEKAPEAKGSESGSEAK